MNLFHMTKFSINLCFTVHFFYPKTNSFTLVLSITVVLKCFSCTFSILRNTQLESESAPDVTVNLSNNRIVFCIFVIILVIIPKSLCSLALVQYYLTLKKHEENKKNYY